MEMIRDVLPYETTLTVSTITVKTANKRLSQEYMASWCIHICISKHGCMTTMGT